LISAREEESKRLARELHDAFSQRLAVLGMEASALEQDPALPDSLRQSLRAMGEKIGRLAKDVHQLSRELHPSILDDLGLTAALRAECGAFSRQYGIPVRFEPSAIPDGLSPAVSLGLYRIAQESLRNVGKHARATAVRVTLAATEGAEKPEDLIRLVIEDNGSGFDLERIKGRRGLGLVSMEERVRLAEGHLAIRSQPGSGTTVEVSIPVRRSAA
jgi:signal transduction histidine kinase